jgi:hypothetical protein
MMVRVLGFRVDWVEEGGGDYIEVQASCDWLGRLGTRCGSEQSAFIMDQLGFRLAKWEKRTRSKGFFLTTGK